MKFVIILLIASISGCQLTDKKAKSPKPKTPTESSQDKQKDKDDPKETPRKFEIVTATGNYNGSEDDIPKLRELFKESMLINDVRYSFWHRTWLGSCYHGSSEEVHDFLKKLGASDPNNINTYSMHNTYDYSNSTYDKETRIVVARSNHERIADIVVRKCGEDSNIYARTSLTAKSAPKDNEYYYYTTLPNGMIFSLKINVVGETDFYLSTHKTTPWQMRSFVAVNDDLRTELGIEDKEYQYFYTPYFKTDWNEGVHETADSDPRVPWKDNVVVSGPSQLHILQGSHKDGCRIIYNTDEKLKKWTPITIDKNIKLCQPLKLKVDGKKIIADLLKVSSKRVDVHIKHHYYLVTREALRYESSNSGQSWKKTSSKPYDELQGTEPNAFLYNWGVLEY